MKKCKQCNGNGKYQVKDESNRLFARIVTCRACKGTGYVETKREESKK